MIDIINELKAIQRAVGAADSPVGPAKAVTLTRDYDADIEDVWDALTSPERLPRWFAPVSGDFRLGGRYQIEGNAGGEILTCDRPRMLKLSWIYGEPTDKDFSEVEVRLSSISDDQTRLVLNHVATVDEARWHEYGAGAVGVGWDLSILGLGLHLSGGELSTEERQAWMMATSPDARAFMTESSAAWGAALEASGADPEHVAKAVANTTAFYVPEVA